MQIYDHMRYFAAVRRRACVVFSRWLKSGLLMALARSSPARAVLHRSVCSKKFCSQSGRALLLAIAFNAMHHFSLLPPPSSVPSYHKACYKFVSLKQFSLLFIDSIIVIVFYPIFIIIQGIFSSPLCCYPDRSICC